MPHDPVLLTGATRTAMIAAAREAWPREMAGLVGGTGTVITDFHELPNVAIAGDRFAVTPPAFAAAVAEFERRGVAFLGFAHSHPNGTARLSLRDHRELWRDCLQFVLGVGADGQHALACFSIRGNQAHELPVTTIDSPLRRDSAAPIGQAPRP